MKLRICIVVSFFLIATISYAQRNVVLLIADDIGTDYFGFSEDKVDTVGVPNIRSLLTKGIRFKNAMANPVCSPTRSGMLTGRYSFRTGVGYVVGSPGAGELDTAEITIPRLLKNYNPAIGRAHIGKWHLQGPNPSTHLLYPNVMGWQHFEGPFSGAISSFTNWTKITNGITSTVTTYATSENVNNAVSWLRTQGNNRVFLWLAFNAPHTPLHLPPSSLHTYTNLPGTPADINNNPKSYFKAMMQALDTEIGRLIDSLKAMNRYDSTDFIFMGDNGNTQQTAQISNLSHAKASIYQYGVHEPFIISGPSVVNPGRVSDALINTVDVFATILDLFGHSNWLSQIPLNKPVDSKSLLPIIKSQTVDVRPWTFTETFRTPYVSGDGKAIRNKDYKLIRFDNGVQELYNLNLDPNEAVNLLPGALNPTDISNYYYLCNEMATLVGNSNVCKNEVGMAELIHDAKMLRVYPNPFKDFIRIEDLNKNDEYQLLNVSGQILYKGKNIGEKDFSYLPKGVYILQNTRPGILPVRLVKE